MFSYGNLILRGSNNNQFIIFHHNSPWTNPNLRVTTQSTTTVGENSFHSESPSGQTESTGTTEIQTESTGTTERNKEIDNIACSICNRNIRSPGKCVIVSGYNNDIGPCECQITVNKMRPNSDPFNTEVNETYFPDVCNYSLLYWLEGNTTKVDSKLQNDTYHMNLNGTLHVRMENHLIGSGDLCFTFTVTTVSPDYHVSIQCQNLKMNTETPVPSPTKTPSPETSTESQKVDSVTTVEKTVLLSTSMSTREQTQYNTETNDSIIDDDDDGDDDGDDDDDGKSLLVIILGCVIGVLVIILIVIITCVLLRRWNRDKNTSSNSENPNNGTTNMAVYSSLDNDLKDSGTYEQIQKQPEHVSEQKEHVTEQQEHVTEQHEHVTEQQGHVHEEPYHVPIPQDHVPETNNEYANVTKKPIFIDQSRNILKVNGDYENMKE